MGCKCCKTEFGIPSALLGTWYSREIPEPSTAFWKRDLNRTNINVSFALSVSSWCSLSCHLNLLIDLFLLFFILLSLKLFGQLAVSCHLWSFFLILGMLDTWKYSCIAPSLILLVLTAFLGSLTLRPIGFVILGYS